MFRLLRRLSVRFRRAKATAELREEIETHRSLRQRQLEHDGLTTAEAARVSHERLGPVALVEDDVREIWGTSLDALAHDVRYGLRSLVVKRAFTITTVGTLALCVGANLAVFTIADALWLRPPTVRDPARVVMISGANDLSGTSEGFFFAEHGLEPIRLLPPFQTVAGQVATSGGESENRPHVTITGRGGEVEALAVTPEYFAVTGLTILGRDFTKNDDTPGAAPTAILSDRLWRSVFRADRAVVGTVIDASPVPIQVIGIAPPGFHGIRLGEQADIWIPRALVPVFSLAGMGGTDPALLAFARLAPGVTPAAAEASLARDLPARSHMAGTKVIPVSDLYGSPVGRTILVNQQAVLWVAAAVALLVLLGGCATLLAVVFVQYERRRQELAVRLALGCSRARLVRGLAVELLGLIGCGAVGAIGLSWLGLRALPSLSLPGGIDLGRLDLSPDARIVLFGMAVTLAAVGLAAFVPMRRSTNPNLVGDLASTTARSTPSSLRIRHGVLATHVAASVIVLVCAGLFVRTVEFGLTAGPGFDVDRVLFADIQMRSNRVAVSAADLDCARNADAVARGACYLAAESAARDRQSAEDAAKVDLVITALRAIPGVGTVAFGRAPIGLDQAASAGHPAIVTSLADGRQAAAAYEHVGSGYFDAVGVRRLAGRGLLPADVGSLSGPSDGKTVLITHALADGLWPGRDPLGQTFSATRDGSPIGSFRVGGVVSDVAMGSLRLDRAAAFFAATDVKESVRPFTVHLAVGAAVEPATLVPLVTRAIREEYPNAPSVNVTTGRDVIMSDIGRERLGAWFFSSFGLIALVLSVGGVFGLVSYLAESRRREVGIRTALGARPDQVIWLFVSSGLWPVVAGTLAGLAAAALISRAVNAFLLGVSQFDPGTYAAMALSTILATALAAIVAAWRVKRFSPTEALRGE